MIFYLFLLLMINSLSAQISYNIVKNDVLCNNTEYGSIEINVTSINTPYSFSWNTGQVTPMISGLGPGTYSVLVTDGSGNDTTVSVEIHQNICQMAPAIIFTPNGDGINDVWVIENFEFFPQSWIMVYNRLGQRVFEQRGFYEPWDGKDLFGSTVPDASYFYVIYHKGSDEGTIIKGSVSIIK